MTECCEICGEPFLTPEHKFAVRDRIGRILGWGHSWCIQPTSLLRHLREARVQLAQGGIACPSQPLSSL